MSLAGIARSGQRAAERMMTDACTIRRGASGEPVYDPATRQNTAPTGDLVYTGRCRVRAQQMHAHTAEVGEAPVSLRMYIVSVPMDVVDVRLNDLVVITASQIDTALIGTPLRVQDVALGSQITARRLVCQEVDR